MADERGSVVVRERSQQAKGPGSILGWKFLLFNKKDSLYQLKNFLSVLKMATTVYETETCRGEEVKLRIKRCVKHPVGNFTTNCFMDLREYHSVIFLNRSD